MKAQKSNNNNNNKSKTKPNQPTNKKKRQKPLTNQPEKYTNNEQYQKNLQ